MKLLIVTQKVDQHDDVLGFMHRWIAEFAAQCEQVTVICLYEGEHSLPGNVRVFSLGKEWGVGRFGYMTNFFRLIWKERAAYDSVFVHMNVEYVVLGGLLWRMMGKRVGLWYAHGHVPMMLRVAEKFVNVIFTSTKSGCRLIGSSKIRVVGQGIDTDFFVPGSAEKKEDEFHIVVVGRISPIKNYETLIRAIALVIESEKISKKIRVTIVGGAGLPEQEKYLEDLKSLVLELKLDGVVDFVGPRANTEILSFLQSADLFVNTSLTGSLDKAMLEAMACGVPVLTCNEAMVEVLEELTAEFMFKKRDAVGLSEKIILVNALSTIEFADRSVRLRDLVKNNHGIHSFVKKIISIYGNV